MGAIRWGILGTGRIASNFTLALKGLPENEHTVCAVASRCKERAFDFAKKYNVPVHYGSYEDLAKDPSIDVAYIGVVLSAHYDLCVMLLEAGKHVLCEKPLCSSSHETCHVIQLAQQKKLFLLEGFWTRFFPIFKRFREEIELESIGEVQLVDVNLGFNVSNKDNHLHSKERGGGVLRHYAVYGLQLGVMLFGRKPDKIVADGILSDSGVDQVISLNIHYSNRRLVRILSHSLITLRENAAVIYGTKGTIKIPDFISPSEMITPTQKYNVPLPALDLPFAHPRFTGLRYEAQAVRDSLLKGETEHPLMPLEDSIAVSLIIDEADRQLGIHHS